MSCTLGRLILESIRTWLASTPSIEVLARIELRWIEVDALVAWPALEEFLGIIFFERQRDICVAERIGADRMTLDEAALLIALIVARWDPGAAAQYLRPFLSEGSALAAAAAAARLRSVLSRQPYRSSFAAA